MALGVQCVHMGGTSGVAGSGQENAALQWVLLSGNRVVVVAGLSAAVFVLVLVLGAAGVVGVATASLVSSVFVASMTGVFTLVSITISINQLILSRVMGSPARIDERTDAVDQFRATIASAADEPVTPPRPGAFLQVVAGTLRDRADALDAAVSDSPDPDLRADAADVAGRVRDDADRVDAAVERSSGRLVEVLLAVLDDSYSRYLHRVRSIRAAADDLAVDERAALDDLASALVEMNRTRHYLKTLYIHEELARVSQLMLATGFASVGVGVLTILLYADGEPVVAGPVLLVVVSAAVAAVVVPLSVLVAYGLRLATVGRRTTTFGTFTPVEETP